MRYYSIQIFKPGTTGTAAPPPSEAPSTATGSGTATDPLVLPPTDVVASPPSNPQIFREWTSYPKVGTGNQNDPGALNIVLDAYVNEFALPQGQAAVSVQGVSIDDLSQANNFTNCEVYIFAGFQKGLPLNNQSQAGLIIQGTIWQSYGNWVGTQMSLEFVIIGPGATADQKTNISFTWKAGTSLASALAATFKTAFPKLRQNINVNPKLIVAHDEVGVYQSMPAFAQYLKPFTQKAIGGTYPGVSLAWTPTQINAYDQSTQSAAVQLAFADLIGQPVWLNPFVIQFMTPLRADLNIDSYVTMPKGILGNPANPSGAPGAVITTSASHPEARQASIFNGTFQINKVHHMGIFRQADGEAWVTVFDATAQTTSTTPPLVTDSLAVAP
jgi:hypothetical protein